MCWVREHEWCPARWRVRVVDLLVWESSRSCLDCLWFTHLPEKFKWPSHSCFSSGKGLTCTLHATLVITLIAVPLAVRNSEEGNGTSLLSLTWKGKGLVLRSLPPRKICSWEKCSSLWMEKRINPACFFEVSSQLCFVTAQRAQVSYSSCFPWVTGT